MKPFWQRPPKKNKKKKRKPKPELSKQVQLERSEPRLASWVPPYSAKPKIPVAEKNILMKSPATYQISPAPFITEEKSPLPSFPEQKVVRPKNRQAKKNFLKTFWSLAERWRSWDVWTDFITMAACMISNSVDGRYYNEREETYLRTIKKYNKQEQARFPELYAYLVIALEEDPEQDFLGDIYTELGLNSKEHKQIFTPYHLCHLMAEFTICDLVERVNEKGVVEIHDCCCGAGATLIAASNVAKEKLGKAKLNHQDHILVTGQDVDYLVTLMCYIQLSLLGVAGYFKVGNALTDPMTDGDDLANYWFTPMYFFPVWRYRRIWHNVDKLIGGSADAEVHEN